MGTSRSYDHRGDCNSATATHYEHRELKHYGLQESKELNRNGKIQIPAATQKTKS